MQASTITLKNIVEPIDGDIKIFQNEFENALKSDVRLINSISKYMLRNRGKNIRPILTILSSRLIGEPSVNSYRAAAMMELLHVATLIHDDVVDDGTLRRGRASINRIWKNKISVLMGDFILSRALISMIGIRDFDALELISSTAEKLSSGEILQIEKSITGRMTEDIYYEMISQKTASLIATSCELGAITTTKNKKDRSLMQEYGHNLGMAFQIKDDLFDLVGSEDDTGKNGGADVKKNMITLPLIYCWDNLPRSEINNLKKLLSKKRKTKKVLEQIRYLVDSAGGISYANAKLNEFSDKAKNAISNFPDSKIKKSLVDLVSFNLFRTR